AATARTTPVSRLVKRILRQKMMELTVLITRAALGLSKVVVLLNSELRFDLIAPAAAEGFVKGDDGQKLIALRARLGCAGKRCCWGTHRFAAVAGTLPPRAL